MNAFTATVWNKDSSASRSATYTIFFDSGKIFLLLYNVKKACLILFSVFYFVVACGFNVSLHYCAGKLKGVSIIQSKEDGCCGNKKKSKGCCNEKHLSYKLNDNQHHGGKIIVSQPFSKQLFTAPLVLRFSNSTPAIDLYLVPDSNAPPFDSPQPVYLLNGNFRI